MGFRKRKDLSVWFAEYGYNFRVLERIFNSLFTVENLPETMDINFINTYLNMDGYIALLRADDGTLRCLQGAIYGIDVYNRPTGFYSANPVRKYSGIKRTIDKDCVILCNTRNKQFPQSNLALFLKYADLLDNVDTSINAALYNTRVSTIYNASNDQEAQKIRVMFDQVAVGKPFIITSSQKPVDVLKQNVARPILEQVNNLRSQYVLDLLLRDRWTILCNFLTEIGINNTPFEKAERQITDEVNSNNELLEITNFEFLKARQEGFSSFNKMFGTDVKVSFNRKAAMEIFQRAQQQSGEEGNENV